MDIKVYRTFVSVAENRHFGRAAEQLYITQAAVSARIKQLEEFYSTPMFTREKNNLTLTPSGEALLPFAHLVIDQIEQSKSVVKLTSKQRINFNMAATPNVWDAFLSNRIHELDTLIDGVVLGTEISVREAIQRKLEDKSLNIAFLADPIKDSEFDNTLVSYFDISLVGTKPEFDEHSDDYIFVDWGITFAKEHAANHKVLPVHRTSTATIALELLLSKGGFAYLPTELVADYIDEGVIFNIESAIQLKRPIYLTQKKSNIDLELSRKLVEALTSAQ